MRLLAAVLSLFLFSPALPVLHAQMPSAGTPSPCDGTMVITRVSLIKPGQMSLFLKAVDAQQLWYRASGVPTNRIVVGKVIDPRTGVVSDTEVVTYHINAPGSDVQLPRGNDGYKAFVQMFRDSSDIKFEYYTCTPKM